MEQKIICTSCDCVIDGDERTYTIHGDIICGEYRHVKISRIDSLFKGKEAVRQRACGKRGGRLMYALFGLIGYGNRFSTEQRSRIISVLSKECEVRGTDATRIAYNSGGKLHIYKRAVSRFLIILSPNLHNSAVLLF